MTGYRKLIAFAVAVAAVVTLALRGVVLDAAYSSIGMLFLAFAGTNVGEWVAKRQKAAPAIDPGHSPR